MKPERISVSPDTVSTALRDDIRDRLLMSTVALYSATSDPPVFMGTATCITSHGRRWLITAGHVWNELKDGTFAVAVDEGRPLVTIENDYVETTIRYDGSKRESGPDVALIQVPEPIASDLLPPTSKMYFNLDLERERFGTPPTVLRPLYVVVGFPAAHSQFGSDSGENEDVLRASAFFFADVQAESSAGFDYLIIPFDHEGRKDLPRSYGGVSGGGVWAAEFTVDPTSGALGWTGRVSLQGVAYFEKFITKERGCIRCHGPQGIHDLLLA